MITAFGHFRQVSGVRCQCSEDRGIGMRNVEGRNIQKSEPKNQGKANRRMSNVEPQNVEGWYRCALSFL